jgi:hypothetical protein
MAKKKGMNRTAGTARRKMSASERVSYGLKTGAPLTGSASGVKSISLKQAGEALTQGIVSVRDGKLKFSPEGLAMALPVGKVAKAAKALRAAGNIGKAAALEARVLAKQAGRELGPDAARNFGPKTLPPVGPTLRNTSESVFPRLPSAGNLPPGSARTFDTYADPLLEGAGRFARGTKRGNKLVKAIEKNEVQSGMYIGSKEAIKRAAFNSTRPVAKLPKGINEIKEAVAKRGIKVTEQGASKMARLLEERAKRRGR